MHLNSFFYYVLISILFVSFTSQTKAQTKKEVLFSLDTLMKSKQDLSQDFNKLQQEWREQNAFFEHVKSTFFEVKNINMSATEAPAHFDKLYGDLKTKIVELSQSNDILIDSLKEITASIDELIIQNESYSKILLSSLNKSSFPQSEVEFVGNWDLFLDPVQVQVHSKPFESGLISFNPFLSNDSIKQYNIYKIEFAPDKLATLYFNGGKSQKCFYTISEFSKDKPYIIRFSKQEEFKMAITVSPLPNGLMVSYEIPKKTEHVIYYYGLMKK